jgi:hypothetical protein
VDNGGVDIAAHVFVRALFGKNNRHREILRSYARDPYARCFDSQNFIYITPVKTALELLADLLKKVHVDLVIEKHIHLENIVPDHFAVSNYALLKQLQILVPPKEKYDENTIIV